MIYFEKSLIAPISLEEEKSKSSGTYNTEEVIERLKEDFHNKCYICEQKEPLSINIEHFIAHKGNIDLKFSWENLYLSCGHCNNTKLAKYDEILNCTSIDDNVEMALYYKCNPFPMEKAEIKVRVDSLKARNTKELIEKTFNGEHTPQKKLESANLRNKLIHEIRDFQNLLFDYFENNKNEIFKIKIEEHLSSRSAFTAFKRWIIRDNEQLVQEFGYCIA
ncbi:HNH endonuclease [Aliarcobacter butzleri]|uniref:HNH endonuclease n=1 Tax=Aliarcobacter butzleri TaxID=28197 RepID=UPI001EDA7C29|nr:HNH endonuclease [Aliarcobacter butzleri]MCG3688683.1 HNH endonuclease [Aliarcobacter butzleri]MCT7635062.1 HNH endonuclease [Aliarcobacter butzleri]